MPPLGAEELIEGILKCHSYSATHEKAGFRSMLCHEREARQKAEAEVESLRYIRRDRNKQIDKLEAALEAL